MALRYKGIKMKLPAIPKWVLKDSVSLESVIARFKYGTDLEELGQVIQGEALYVLKTEVHKDKQTGWGKVVAEFADTVGSKLTQSRANKLIDLYELYDPEICIPYTVTKIDALLGTTAKEKAINYEAVKLAVNKEQPSNREIKTHNTKSISQKIDLVDNDYQLNNKEVTRFTEQYEGLHYLVASITAWLDNKDRYAKGKLQLDADMKKADKLITQALVTLKLNKMDNLEGAKASYKRLAKKYHPDMGGSEEQMSKLNEAFSVIKEYLSKE